MDTATILANIAKAQNILKLLTFLQLTTYLWPPEVTVQDGSYADFIIVGGGTAGSLIASYLVKQKNISVIVIEAGGMGEFETTQPGLFPLLKNSKFDWNFTTSSHSTLQQGRVLGGSSQVDYMIYGIGNPEDYNKWASLTNDSSWTMKNLCPLIKRTEKVTDPTILNSPDVFFHGTEGKMRIKKYHKSLNDGFFQAYREMGHKVLNDINAMNPLGYTNTYFTIGQGIRQSTAYAFLSPERDNPNLKVMYNSVATKIIFDGNKRAVAVQVLTHDKKKITIHARREIIISAGAIKSPQLLMLSGIGPKQHLESKKIKVISNLPVGQNFQDNPTNVMVYEMGIADSVLPINPHEFPVAVMEGRIAMHECQKRADYQILSGLIVDPRFFLQVCSSVFSFKNSICDNFNKALSGRQVHFVTHHLLYAESRGEVLLNTTNPEDKPIIIPNYYSNPRDIERHAKYLKHYNRIVDTTYYKSLDAEFVDPQLESCKGLKPGTDSYWKCYVLGMATTLHNYVGTCAMGSVVDSKLRVLGVKNLRVADASVMPEIVGATVQGTVSIIAQKLVDILFEEYRFSSY
ncbi:ecdysone oxidase-like [Helicoverpa zea]|uniref:ecdysone oxidase-like n=1 Tax=Helicoverpa zea TaxID=7113 RepID=UPI001F59B6F6|nr:ecdysone oxidase-like [Helicoverpa zea]